ncbi:hypothetical protein OC845_006917, partial [Tilletia horrida]
MSPTLAELRRMTKTELKTVHDFTVSRPGFGSVRFLPPVDLSEIPNLSTIAGGIVQIRSKECYVYPGKEECLPGTDGMITGYTPGPKAVQGQALNVAAVISLDRCWPLDRATRDPIKDPDHPRYKQHIVKLEKKADTKFIAFHAATGSWQFQVEHFSRYGIDEDEAEDEPTAHLKNPTDAYKPRLKLLQPTQHGHHTARFDEDITSTISSIEDDDVEDGDEEAPPVEGLGDASDIRPQDTAPIDIIATDPRHVATHPAQPRGLAPFATPDRTMGVSNLNDVHSWAIRRGVQPERVQIMQASLFGAQAPAQPPTGPARPDIMPPASRKHSREMSQQVDPPVAVAENAGAHPSGFPAFRIASQVVPAAGARARKLTRTDLARSIGKDYTALRGDAGLSMGRSFRAGWGPAGVLVHNGTLAGVAFSAGKVQSQGQKRAAEQSVTSIQLQRLSSPSTK